MPLLHQDTSRAGGGVAGPADNRRSLADFLGMNSTIVDMPVAAPKMNHMPMGGTDTEWSWQRASNSPDTAHSPRALLPPNGLSARHSYAAFSNDTGRGNDWGEDGGTSGHNITDLVASLKALAVPSPSGQSRNNRHSASIPSIHFHVSLETNDKVDASWLEQLSNFSNNNSDYSNGGREEHKNNLHRRASFCGVVPSGHNGTKTGPTTWSGTLPPRCMDPSAGFSPKVFLGGIPWEMNEQALLHTLRQFNPLRVEWPANEAGGPRGFAYVTLESGSRVRALLAACRRDGHDWYYRVTSRKTRSKDVQVIPWAVSDACWARGGAAARLAPARTVFVGALHGMLSAAALAYIMDELFPGVVYAGIDCDKNKYPIGSGRVTFDNVRSYVRAIQAAHVDIVTDKFSKKVQVDPYLEDSMCSVCNLQQGPYFCRDPDCYRYYCRSCWSWKHAEQQHKPLMRNSKTGPRQERLNVAASSRSSMHSTPSSPPMSATSETEGEVGSVQREGSPPDPDYSPVPDYSSPVPDYSSPVPDYSSPVPDYSPSPDYSTVPWH